MKAVGGYWELNGVEFTVAVRVPSLSGPAGSSPHALTSTSAQVRIKDEQRIMCECGGRAGLTIREKANIHLYGRSPLRELRVIASIALQSSQFEILCAMFPIVDLPDFVRSHDILCNRNHCKGTSQS